MMPMTLEDVSTTMADIDFAMLSTHSDNGEIAARPMSNNGDVHWQGDSFFFALDGSRSVRDIESDPRVSLSYQSKHAFFRPPTFLAVEGSAEIIRDRKAFLEHWNDDLELYFAEGLDTPGLVLICVHAERIHWWKGQGEGDIVLR